MANIFTDFAKRISIDYTEYRNFLISYWNVKRDAKAIARAMKRAKLKNKTDNRTYYILKDKTGGINEFTKDDAYYWSRVHRPAILAPMNYIERLTASIGLVTSNQQIMEQYAQIQLKKEQDNERSK